MAVPSPFLKLPLTLDLDGLRADLAHCLASPWPAHFNTRDYVGGWSSLALRSRSGSVSDITAHPDPVKPYRDTPLLAQCPHVAAILARLPCRTESVRLLRQAPGGEILPHRDPGTSYRDGVFRLHVPIVTNAGVEFVVAGRRVPMAPGECWYADFSERHSVINRGTTERIHLVIDCIRDPATDMWFLGAGFDRESLAPPPMPDDVRCRVVDELRRQGTPAALTLAATLEAEQEARRPSDLERDPPRVGLPQSPLEGNNPTMESPGLYLHAPALVTRDELETLRAFARDSEFEDGRTTAILAAREVKRNLQLVRRQPPGESAFERLLLDAINRHPLVSAVVMPRKVQPPMMSKYEAGMSYGWHVDSPLMGVPPVRTDLAMTLFLSDPDSYEGGALTVETPAGPAQYRLPAGDAIFYPADRNHCVTPVTRGTRLCAFTWVQSVIRDPSRRELVFLTNQLHSMFAAKDPLSPEARLSMRLYSGLVRMWEE